jgi:catechol 2,3-dioxygenase-like lactoylglutathione lyase family enzyme
MTDTTTASAPAADLSAFKFRLNFFKLVVRDAEAMTAFYRNTFGFDVRSRFELPGIIEVMLALPGEAFTLVLYQNTDGREVTIGTGHGPVGFLTSDVDGAYAHALAHGATDERAPFDLPGMRIAFVRDPEGHQIEMIQFVRPAAA